MKEKTLRLLMFCENANQVHMCRGLVNSDGFPSHVEPEVLVLDWDKETAAWVFGTISALGWEIDATNIFDCAPESLRKAASTAKKSKDRKSALADIGFEYLKRYFNRPDVLLLQFNDTSQRGSSVARVCRNIGLRRLLVQDGFLNFVSKTANLAETDSNFGWGSSHPEFIAVWGEAMRDDLIARHNNNPRTIYVTGAPKPGIQVPAFVDRKPSSRARLKVLWADQSVLDQGKASPDEWLPEYAEIAKSLSDFETDLRLHPSTKHSTRSKLQEAVGGRFSVPLTSSPRIDAEDLRQYDVVVTYYSTVFLDCLANNIPCVVCKTSSLDIELPNIQHPLLWYCDNAAGLEGAVRSAAAIEAHGEAPRDIFRYINANDGVASVLRIIDMALPIGGDSSPTPIERVVSDVEIYSNLRRLQGKKILVLGGSFGNHIGVGKPIKVFVEYLRGLDLEIEFHLATNGDCENLLRKVSGASLVLINSFDVVRSLKERDLGDVYRMCEMMGVPVVFYCHETQFVFRRLMSIVGGKVDAFVKSSLPKSHVLAVSDRQADWLGSMGCKSIRTVYNSVGPYFHPVSPRAASGDRPVVLMVGTQQRRKGVDLFSHVADLAHERGLDWQFVWLGGFTKGAEGCYRSTNVEWMGHVGSNEVREWMARAAVFFLSSIDDPMPLGVGEALMSGIPALVYVDTGFADFITLHRAGEAFNVYEPHVAFEKLASIIADPGKYSVDVDLVRDIVGVNAFGKRMLVALGEIVLSSSSDSTNKEKVSGQVALRGTLHRKQSVLSRMKWGVLNALEHSLPGFVVRPGERVLRKLRII